MHFNNMTNKQKFPDGNYLYTKILILITFLGIAVVVKVFGVCTAAFKINRYTVA